MNGAIGVSQNKAPAALSTLSEVRKAGGGSLPLLRGTPPSVCRGTLSGPISPAEIPPTAQHFPGDGLLWRAIADARPTHARPRHLLLYTQRARQAPHPPPARRRSHASVAKPSYGPVGRSPDATDALLDRIQSRLCPAVRSGSGRSLALHAYARL